MDMRFGTWNVRSLYKAGSLMTLEKGLSKCKFDLVGLQEVRWDRGGTEPAGEYTFSMERGMRNVN
jgi:exonuclease III